MKVDIWSDVMCPFCYIGKRNFENALVRFENNKDIKVVWHSFQLDPNMEYQPGKDVYSYLAERKGQSIEWSKQMHVQVTQMAKDAGLEYNFDKAVINNSYTAHRFLQLAKKHGLGDAAEEALFKAYFTEGKNIGDHDTLIQLGIGIGLGATEVGEVLNSEAFANEVDEDIYMAQQYGIRGVPFFIINNKYAISGTQPSETFLGALNQAWSEVKPKLTNFSTEGATCEPGGEC
ncbi:MAG: DsbA family oxidoreductase [Bacteroidetes bacterium]|nr:DsbA family oxidoreductase [Bacteroidota bacterium]